VDNEERHLEFASQKNSIDLLMDDEDIMIVSIDLFHIDEEGECNLNQCNISRQSAEISIPTFANKPIAFRFNSKMKELANDVVEHFHNENELFDMRVAGHIPTDSRITFIERDNGKTYCNVEAVIQKRLLPKLVNLLQLNDGEMKISVVFKAIGVQNEETGIFIIESFVLQEITILSNRVQEGIEGSHMKVLKFSKKEQEIANVRYLQFAKNQLSTEDIFVKIKNKKEEILLNNSLTAEVLKRRIWKKLRDYKYSDGNWNCDKYWYEDVDIDKKLVIVYDRETDCLYSIPYKLSKDGDVTLKEEDRKKVEKDETYRQIENACEFLFAKEEYGTGNEIKVDKSKDAMSESEWGKVNKTTLRKDILDAKNYKSLVKDVYLIVEEGWEDAPSEKLKYPVMEIKGDTAVYNRYGLASALTYAKANNEEAIVSKIEGLYKKLDIDDEDKSKDESVENALAENVAKTVEGEITSVENSNDSIVLPQIENTGAVSQPEITNQEDNGDGEDDTSVEDWESKYNDTKNALEELTQKYAVAETKLKSYKEKEDKETMSAYLNQNKDAFDEESMKVMASKIDTMEMSCEEFKKEVDDKFVAYLKNKYIKDKQKEEVSNKLSTELSFMADFTKKIETINKDKNKILSSDEILARVKK
jgi:hypothetical protein